MEGDYTNSAQRRDPDQRGIFASLAEQLGRPVFENQSLEQLARHKGKVR